MQLNHLVTFYLLSSAAAGHIHRQRRAEGDDNSAWVTAPQNDNAETHVPEAIATPPETHVPEAIATPPETHVPEAIATPPESTDQNAGAEKTMLTGAEWTTSAYPSTEKQPETPEEDEDSSFGFGDLLRSAGSMFGMENQKPETVEKPEDQDAVVSIIKKYLQKIMDEVQDISSAVGVSSQDLVKDAGVEIRSVKQGKRGTKELTTAIVALVSDSLFLSAELSKLVGLNYLTPFIEMAAKTVKKFQD